MSVSVDEDDPIENEGNSFCSTQPQKNPNNYFFSPNIHIKARRRRKKKKKPSIGPSLGRTKNRP